MILGRKVKAAMSSFALFMFGMVVSLSGIAIAKATPLAHFFSTSLSARDGNAVALACIPKAEEDDIFFVSCGGIY